MTTPSLPTPDEITKLVTAQEAVTEELRERMQEDYDWFRLNWTDDRQKAQSDGYQKYISNEPRTYAKRIISWLTTATMNVRIPIESMQMPDRASASMMEQFVIGSLRKADDLLSARMMPSLRDLLAFYITIRGRYIGRAMLVKNPDMTTSVVVSPFDPLHTFYAIGESGLRWCIHRQTRTREEIKAEYGIELGGGGGNGTGHVGIYTYDYYDGQVNAVCTRDTWLKVPSPHFAPSIPIFAGVVGATPPVEAKDGGGEGDDRQDTYKDFGESVFDENRGVYDNFNQSMSDMMTLVRRSVKPPLGVPSRDGSKTLDKDPYRDGSVVSFRVGEEPKALELLRMSLDTGPFLAQVSGEMQRGSLPHSVYGDLQFQLSGFAINTLRQGVDASVAPRIQAKQRALTQISKLLIAQYATGGFAALALSGRDNQRQWFSRQFPPEAMDVNAHLEITLAPQLPQDEMQRFTMAQIAREGKMPILSDRTIRDTILKIQDVDAEEDMIKEQIASDQGSPVAVLHGFIESAARRGRPDLVQIYMQELQNLLMQRAMAQQAALMGPGVVTSRGTGGAAPGIAPTVQPPAMEGIPPPVPNPQSGPLVPPGTPRPGAQGQPA